ncbi:hypothetical protein RSOLAG1IB_12600 [Rhizoctonia solani AG-1 IB]|uniref:Uncharacterized protein n=1 Tax=Thanatephorus cucumeris (strain AG1-IB / isolate 7/3/14) TaxID=1108050 RepID=A0A0B7FY63_THACB|nr:hypothetical protein RSOLAG1IB_12600 [Rhizoctonia solani AG-1 IB]
MNGALHFKLDDFPPVQAKGLKLGLINYLEVSEGALHLDIPVEYLTLLEFCPKFTFNTGKAQKTYSTLQPTIATLSEWNTPTWDTLLVAQHLC